MAKHKCDLLITTGKYVQHSQCTGHINNAPICEFSMEITVKQYIENMKQ